MAQGHDFARIVKAELQELYSQLEMVCIRAVGDRETWPHNKALIEKSNSTPRSSESFSQSPSGEQLALWAAFSIGGFASWKQIHGKDFQYAFNPGFDEREHAAVMEYKDVARAQDRLVSNLHSRRTELDQAKARELWDEA